MMRKRTPNRKSLRFDLLEERLYLATSYTVTALPPLPASNCAQAFGVNESGWVVGDGCNSSGHGVPLLWRFDSTGQVVTTALPVSPRSAGLPMT